jgi:hypothetical protein
MKNSFEFKLIEGEFSSTGAARVILPLINKKINYHSLEGFSNEIRFNTDPSHSRLRIKALQEAQVSIEELLALAESKGMKIRIKSSIEIEIE